MLAPLVPMATERHSTGRTFGPSDSASRGVISLAEGLFSDRSENIFWLADPLGGVPTGQGNVLPDRIEPKEPDIEDHPVSSPERVEARQRIRSRRQLSRNLSPLVMVNAVLMVIWAKSGRRSFWPDWVMAASGFVIVQRFWSTSRIRGERD